MKRNRFSAVLLAAAFAFSGGVFAQDDLGSMNATVTVPSFDVRLSLGFNYDLLRSLTDVDFTQPKGYFGFNVPFNYGGNIENLLGKKTVDDIFDDTDIFKRGENFKPTAGASQNANYTVRVDVPMVGGVGSFAYTQNFYFDFKTALGGSGVISAYQDLGELSDDIDGFMSMKGAIRLPLSVNMGWETMTFGYAYRVADSDDLVFALNLHRHLFSANVGLKADIDLLGYVHIPRVEDLHYMEFLNFNSDKCNGAASGRFRAEAWTPSIGLRWGRFSLNSRFGLKNVKASGSATGGFRIPKIVDLGTGDVEVIERFDGLADSVANNPFYALELLGEDGVIPRTIDSIEYHIDGKNFSWSMPHGHTIAFDIIPRRLSLSFTKLFGEINMKIDNIKMTQMSEGSEPGSWANPKDSLLTPVDVGLRVDYVFMAHLDYPWFFVNLGLSGVEARSGDRNAFEDIKALRSVPKIDGVYMMLPIVSGGFNLGTRLQLRVEADILPLPAVKTGVNYYF